MPTNPLFDFSGFSVGGAQRPDSFTGMNQGFNTALGGLFSAAPPDIQQQLQVSSGFRSEERQAELWDQALKKYGSVEEARKWVAPPGRSQHGLGFAADLKFLDPAARQWVKDNAGQHGLAFPLANEPWHIELAGDRLARLQGGTPGPQQGGIFSAPQTPGILPDPDSEFNLADIFKQDDDGASLSGALGESIAGLGAAPVAQITPQQQGQAIQPVQRTNQQDLLSLFQAIGGR